MTIAPEQIGLAIFGLTAGWLGQDGREDRRKYAPFFGLCGQVFWLSSTFMAEQWGMFLLSIFYTLTWCKGIKTYWLKKEKKTNA